MTANKVYIIEPPFPCADPVGTRDALGRAIGAAAANKGIAVWFHDFEWDVAGYPCVLLECRDEFMETVRALPGFGNDKSLDHAILPTERSERLQAYFMNRPANVPTLRF
jgi:hypothetical protein